MVRGGAFNNEARNLRAAYRNNNEPENRNNDNGFRVVLSAGAQASRSAPWAPRRMPESASIAVLVAATSFRECSACPARHPGHESAACALVVEEEGGRRLE